MLDRMNVSHRECNVHNVYMVKRNIEGLNVYGYKTL